LSTEGNAESSSSQEIGTFRRNFVSPLSPSFEVISEGEGHLLTVREVAARLSVSTATIYALCDRGELPHIRISNAIRISPADLETFLNRIY
jgi:excisionase family DNA binding protein